MDLVTTDGFLFPNAVLEARGLMERKGFPESYDVRRLLRFVADVKSGRPRVSAPLYSHLRYDIVPGEVQAVAARTSSSSRGSTSCRAAAGAASSSPTTSTSPSTSTPRWRTCGEWYVRRFLRLRETVFRDPDSYFHRYSSGSPRRRRWRWRCEIWEEINEANLRENIEPTRERADLVLEKGIRHGVQRVRMRRL